MRKIILLAALVCAVAIAASAQMTTDEGLPTQVGGLRNLEGARRCALLPADRLHDGRRIYTASAGLIFNGSVMKAGGANILNIGNGTNAQSVRVYNTDDGAGNAEYGMVDWAFAAGEFTIGTNKTGTGTIRTMDLNAPTINIKNAGTAYWQFSLGIGSRALMPVTDNSFDFGASAQAIRSAYVKTSIQGGAVKTLPETSATGFVTVAIPNSGGCAGYVDYTVFAADATNTQLKSGQLYFSAAATSGGTVTAATISDVNTLNPVTSGTLTNTMTQTTGANLITLLANATSSLTQTTLEVRYRVMLQGGVCTVTGL
jgi:hypothetical protein